MTRQVRFLLVGAGNVGRRFLELVILKEDSLRDSLNLELIQDSTISAVPNLRIDRTRSRPVPSVFQWNRGLAPNAIYFDTKGGRNVGWVSDPTLACTNEMVGTESQPTPK